MRLTEFLLARIAEDEALASGREGSAFYRWTYKPYEDKLGGYVTNGVAADWHYSAFIPVSEHVANWDPARAMAECKAKRRVVDLHTGRTLDRWQVCRQCDPHDEYGDSVSVPYPCPTLRALAIPYADHPDYDESWRP